MAPRLLLLTLVVLGFVLCPSWAGPVGETGEENTDPDIMAIIGGKNADPNRWKWQIALLFRNRFLCGGTLLDELTVLTARHCVSRKRVKRYKVKVGEYNRRQAEPEREEQKIGVSQIIRHPDYDRWSLENDLAIVKLSQPVTLGRAHIDAVPQLATADMDLLNASCFATGWGAHKGNFGTSRVLQEVKLPVITNAMCQLGFPSYEVFDDMVCTEMEGKATCYGDSGGPLQCHVNGTWTLVGVTSWGNYDCLDGPAVYSRVSFNRDWIRSNMEVQTSP